MLLKKILLAQIPVILTIAVIVTIKPHTAEAIIVGYLVPAIFFIASAAGLSYISKQYNELFNKAFFLLMGLRFLFSISVLGFFLGATKIDEIYFTVSFIISYLYQSVTETIFTYKTLTKSSTQKK